MEAKKLSNQSLTIRLAVKLPPCVEGNAFEPDTSVSTSSDTKGQSIESGESNSAAQVFTLEKFSRALFQPT